MTYPDALIYFIELSKTPIKFLSNSEAILRVKYVTYSVDEIKRLRARVNNLIKMINDGDTYGDHSHSDKDLVEEEEI